MTGEDTSALAEGLQSYLDRASAGGPVIVHSLIPFGKGNSGFSYDVQLEQIGRPVRAILRLSPPHARLAGPADVGRQGRIIASLHAAGLPVPCVIAYDAGPVLAERSFMLTEYVGGVSWEQATKESSDRQVAELAIGFLQQLRTCDVALSGIGDEKPITPAAELERWAQLMLRGPEVLERSAGLLRRRLERSQPEGGKSCLVHGDYHYGNLIFGDNTLAAVVDWEIAEIGSPLMDLGSLAVASLRRKYRPEPNPTGNIAIGFDELLSLYGVTRADALWYVALTCFKYAAILGYNSELNRRGKRIDPIYERLIDTTNGLVGDGLSVIDGDLDF